MIETFFSLLFLPREQYPPTPSSLAQIHHKQWKEADVIRMEVKILGILEWEVPRCTYLSFLPAMMRALFGWDASMSPPFDIVSQAQLVLLQEFSFTFKVRNTGMLVSLFCFIFDLWGGEEA